MMGADYRSLKVAVAATQKCPRAITDLSSLFLTPASRRCTLIRVSYCHSIAE